MPIIECTYWIVDNNPKSYVVTTSLVRSPKKLVFPKSICKTLRFRTEAMHGESMLSLDVPEWLLSKMVKEYHLDDYKVRILL